MKKLANIIVLFLTALAIIQCGRVEELIRDALVDDQDAYKGELQGMEYYLGGWFGLAPNWSYDLKMRVDRNGNIKGVLKTPACESTGRVDAYDFADLEVAVHRSEKEIQEHNMIDGGDERLTLSYEDGNEDYFLRRSDSAYKKPVLVGRGLERVREILEDIIKDLEQDADCEKQITSVRYLENYGHVITPVDQVPTADADVANRTSEMILANPLTLYRKDLTVTFRGDVSYLTGSVITVSELTQEREEITFVDEPMDISLAEEAGLIEFVEVRELCARPQIYPQLDRSITVNYANAKSQTGTIGCMSRTQVLNSEKFTEKLLRWVESR